MEVDRMLTAQFLNALSISKTNIVSLMRENDTLTKLLRYTQDDVLENPDCIVNTTIKNEVYRQNLKDVINNKRNVFLTGFNPEAAKSTSIELHMCYTNIKPYQSSTTKIPYLMIDIVVPYAHISLTDGMSLRHDLLFQEVCDTIEGHTVGTVGYLELVDAQESVLTNNTHVVWSVRFKVGELKR